MGTTAPQEIATRLTILYICGTEPDETSLAHLHTLADAGVTAVQLRLKGATGLALYRHAESMARVCRSLGLLFFVNDRLDVALAAHADGVHLGASDLPVARAREIADAACPDGRFLIGATARTPHAAQDAMQSGADYIGCGAAFPSKTKDDTTVIGPEGIALVTSAVAISTVAIGGIHGGNIERLTGSGVNGVAVGHALASETGPGTARAIRRFFEKGVL